MSLGFICMQVANERGFTLGTARLQVAHLPDGSTGFWGSAPGGRPIATRLGVEAPPWRASLEMQGTDEALVDVECLTEGWQYSLDKSTPRQFRKGLRSVVAVQVCCSDSQPHALIVTDNPVWLPAHTLRDVYERATRSVMCSTDSHPPESVGINVHSGDLLHTW